MRWKPDGRAGIEDRRGENDKPNGPVERHRKGMAQWEKENYLRRTGGFPELPLPPELRPVTIPGTSNVEPAMTPASGNFSLPQGPTNPIVDSFFDPQRLKDLRKALETKNRIPVLPPPTSDMFHEMSQEAQTKARAVAAKANAPADAKLRVVRGVQKSGLLDRITTLRKLRNELGMK